MMSISLKLALGLSILLYAMGDILAKSFHNINLNNVGDANFGYDIKQKELLL